MLDDTGLTTGRISAHAAALQAAFLEGIGGGPLGQTELLNPLDGGPHARFLAFRTPSAQGWHDQLMAANCVTDVRGDVLRIGFAIYHDGEDVERLVELIAGLA